MSDSLKRSDGRKLVEILYAEPERNLRTQFRIALKNEQFDGLVDVEGTVQVRQYLAARVPDLLVLDSEIKGGGLGDIIHDIRHGTLGKNPFVPIIVTLWEPTAQIVQELSVAGPDDMLVKPISPQLLLDRIRALTDNRKPFVVTSEYIGPDRRKDPTRQSSIPLIRVPNTLEAKMRGEKIDPTKLNAMVARVQNTINDQRLKRNAFQIAFLVGLILPEVEAKNFGSSELKGHYKRIFDICTDTADRMLGTEYDHVSHLCENMQDVSGRLLDTKGEPTKKDIELLKPLSDAILLGFHPTSDAASMAGEITSALSGYSKRRAGAAARR